MLKDRQKMGDGSRLTGTVRLSAEITDWWCSAGDSRAGRHYICQVTKIHQQQHHSWQGVTAVHYWNVYNVQSIWSHDKMTTAWIKPSSWVHCTCKKKVYSFTDGLTCTFFTRLCKCVWRGHVAAFNHPATMTVNPPPTSHAHPPWVSSIK